MSSNEKLYYIQYGYVGNAMCWWKKGGKGYGTDILKAEKHTREAAIHLVQLGKGYVAWPCEAVDGCKDARKIIIDQQYLPWGAAIRYTEQQLRELSRFPGGIGKVMHVNPSDFEVFKYDKEEEGNFIWQRLKALASRINNLKKSIL